MEAIRRRHRRYRMRVGAGSVAVLAAIGAAVVPFVQQPAGSGGSRGDATPAARPHPAATSTIAKLGCGDAWGNDTWQPHGLQAGPLWLIASGRQNREGWALDVEVANGSTVGLRIPAAARAQLKFLGELYPYGMSPLPAGNTGISFASCQSPRGDYTRFGLVFSLPAGHPATVDVSMAGTPQPVRVTVTCTQHSCRLTRLRHGVVVAAGAPPQRERGGGGRDAEPDPDGGGGDRPGGQVPGGLDRVIRPRPSGR